ncbi:Aste57867_4494 [Aphanomyces stellatus]|uniref:Aste57867_4494 protein n=1 Tax=Aphanomyces stellatus TaxID=120398 RepID=A0A485KDZ3_9STRA|nr:hypothetical protein As57867_004481 [Aphanomyces stellatus]VFT81604.1 Aste57867_4494 [Aphanomyces stellatus]
MAFNLPTSRTALCTAIASGATISYLLFYGHRSKEDPKTCLSQWFEAPFQVEGIVYPTAEHFMMAEKARLFGDEETLADILSAPSPSVAKAFGRSVSNFDEETWCRHRFDIVVRASEAKFGQNPALKAFLMGTKKHVLVEASPRDRIWGIGLGATHADAEDPEKWRGLNLLGFALMVARDTLVAQDSLNEKM